MNRIRLLPEHVANQIAAGEVVERPASVIKELVENALDAQPYRIIVEIQAGGRSLMRVTDDGLGMSRDDALLCLERHATSKIQKAEDLSAVATMGFRGEALPSIASVSRMTLTTRERETDLDPGQASRVSTATATQVIINGGKIIEVKAAGSPPGTSIEVRQLFFNLPARRKFLRSEDTESSHIQHYLTLAALAWPEVAFTFIKDGRMVWQWPAVQGTSAGQSIADRLAALRERMRGIYGSTDHLVAVDASTDLTDTQSAFEISGDCDPANAASEDSIRLWGFIGKPGVARSTRDEQHVFVNRRPVESRSLNYSLMEGYHTSLMKGRYPVCCLFLEISPAAIDVNIHPSKREIKFRQHRPVQEFIAGAVRQALLKFHEGAGSTPVVVTVPAKQSAIEQKPPAPRPQLPDTTPRPEPEFPQFTPLTGTALESWPKRPPAQPSPRLPCAPAPLPETPNVPAAISVEPARPEYRLSSVPGASDGPVPLLKVPLRLLGVVGRLYVVLESDRGLVLVDQHAAHERILFEQMLNRLEQGAAASQRLLLPETIELATRDAEFLREVIPVFNRLGVGLSHFGDRTFLLDSLPPFVKASDPRKFVLDVIDDLKASGHEVNTLRLGEQVVAKTVCRHAVKANDPLTEPELQNLVNDLRHCAMPYTCPHGRPTLIEMNFRELERKFGRITS
jgi:DNA mismatch repair protein MutL